MDFFEGFVGFFVAIISLAVIAVLIIGIPFFATTNPQALWWFVPVAVIGAALWFGLVAMIMD